MNRAAVIVALAAPMLAAAAPSSAWKQKAISAAAPFIDRANAEWTHAIVSGDASALSAPYAATGIFIGPDGSVTKGKAAVRAMYKKRPAGVKVVKASIHSDGRTAAGPNDVYEWGTARLTLKRGKAVRQTSGRYLTVWHREGKRWLITRNIAF